MTEETLLDIYRCHYSNVIEYTIKLENRLNAAKDHMDKLPIPFDEGIGEYERKVGNWWSKLCKILMVHQEG